jgi:hypothetical protein
LFIAWAELEKPPVFYPCIFPAGSGILGQDFSLKRIKA